MSKELRGRNLRYSPYGVQRGLSAIRAGWPMAHHTVNNIDDEFIETEVIAIQHAAQEADTALATLYELLETARAAQILKRRQAQEGTD